MNKLMYLLVSYILMSCLQTGKIATHQFRFASEDERDRWHSGVLEQVAALILEVHGSAGGATDDPHPRTVEKTDDGTHAK
jgi:hypothetical protein